MTDLPQERSTETAPLTYESMAWCLGQWITRPVISS